MFEYWSKKGQKYCNNKLKSNSQYLYKNGFITLRFNLVGGQQNTLWIPNVELFLDFRAYCYVILEERVKNSLEICSIYSCVIYFFFFKKGWRTIKVLDRYWWLTLLKGLLSDGSGPDLVLGPGLSPFMYARS